jgi:hypothetical protein
MRRLPVFLLLLFCLNASPAFAWNAAGHRLTAALAWERMAVPVRQRATALLRQHPDYERWKKRQQEADPDYGVFLEAAIWPDNIRYDPRFHHADEPPTPLLPGFPHMLRQTQWHYRDEPGVASKGEIDTRLEQLARDLATGDAAAQIYALPWFLHLVGDIHQPLHVGGRGDRGGNGFEIEVAGRASKSVLTLHAYWDDLPGPSRLRGAALENALRPLREQPSPPQGDIALWVSENRALLLQDVYPAAADSPRLTPAFQRRAQSIAQSRLAAAGVRMGRWLNRLLR